MSLHIYQQCHYNYESGCTLNISVVNPCVLSSDLHYSVLTDTWVTVRGEKEFLWGNEGKLKSI